jgi:acetyl esterase/lipase
MFTSRRASGVARAEFDLHVPRSQKRTIETAPMDSPGISLRPTCVFGLRTKAICSPIFVDPVVLRKDSRQAWLDHLFKVLRRNKHTAWRRRDRTAWRFVPGAAPLDLRTMLSSAILSAVDHVVPTPGQAPPAEMLGQGSAAPWQSGADELMRLKSVHHAGTKIANVPFPTVDGQFQLLDVYLPTGRAPAGGWPVLVAIHGGGWRRFSKNQYGPRIASAFVPRGFAVVAPNYVLSAPGAPTWPLNFEDVEAAVQWVRGQARSLDINPARIAAIGESAGANLAALLGTTEANGDAGGVSSQVNAVIAFSTPTDLPALYAESFLGGLAAAQFLGGTPSQVPAHYLGASPIDHVSRADAPMLLVHGLQDPLIPVRQSKGMSTALTAAGVPNRLVLVHGGHDLDFPAHYADLVLPILAFLDTTWNH